MEESYKLSDEMLEAIAGGRMTTKVDNMRTYCPYHLREHAGIKLMEEVVPVGKGFCKVYWCSTAGRYFFEAGNGWFDLRDGMLVRKR